MQEYQELPELAQWMQRMRVSRASGIMGDERQQAPPPPPPPPPGGRLRFRV